MILKEILNLKVIAANLEYPPSESRPFLVIYSLIQRFVETNANFVYCFVCKEVLSTGHDGGGNSHGFVVVPRHSQVADLLPGFPGWVPREHRG